MKRHRIIGRPVAAPPASLELWRLLPSLWTRAVGRVAVGLGLLALGACSSTDPAPAPASCPTALLLDGAERTTAYRPGAEARASEIRYFAVLGDLTTACRYKDEGVEVDLMFTLSAGRGPAFSSTPEEAAYFIATMGPNGQILQKEVYPAELDFEEGYEGARWSEELTLLIRSVTPDNGSDYKLYVGFQPDDAELERRRQSLR